MNPAILQMAIVGPVAMLGILGALAFGLWLDKINFRKKIKKITDG